MGLDGSGVDGAGFGSAGGGSTGSEVAGGAGFGSVGTGSVGFGSVEGVSVSPWSGWVGLVVGVSSVGFWGVDCSGVSFSPSSSIFVSVSEGIFSSTTGGIVSSEELSSGIVTLSEWLGSGRLVLSVALEVSDLGISADGSMEAQPVSNSVIINKAAVKRFIFSLLFNCG